MKTNRTPLARRLKQALVAVALACCAQGANAQSSTTMTDIHTLGQTVIEMLEDKQGKEIVRIEYDLVFSSGAKETFRTLYEGNEYTIIGFADHRVEDLDIVVYRKSGSSWIEVTKDTATDDTPMVTVTPKSTAQYKIEVKAYRFKSGYSAAHYGLIICHD